MDNYPLVTIITPCYNGEEFLNQYFASILAQTYQHLELIFVNDGSTDRTEEIALSYREALENRGIVYKYLYQPNGGQASAMNTGFREMTGEFLVWPDSDDLMTPDSIEKRVWFLLAHPDYAFVRSRVLAFDFDTGTMLYRPFNNETKYHEDIFMDLINELTFCCCCYMVRVSALRKLYPDLAIFESRQGQNWQILIPMAGNYLCGFIDEDLYLYAVRNNSHSRSAHALDKIVERYLGLKAILLDSIRRSGRTDRDYQKIVDIKYDRILFRVYLDHGELNSAKECYARLVTADAVEEADFLLYLKHYHPFKYQLYQLKQLGIRAFRKVKRIVFKT